MDLRDLPDPEDRPEMEVLLEQRDSWALQEALGLPVLRASRDHQDHRDLQDQLAIWARRVLQYHKGQLVKLVTWVSRDQLDRLVHQALPVNQDRKDQQALKEMLDREDPVGHQDQQEVLVHLDLLVQRDKQETPVVLDHQDPLELRDLAASRDHQGHVVILDPKALLARTDKMVVRVPRVYLETMGHQDQLVSLVPEVTLAHQEGQDCQGLQVHLDSQDLLGNLVLRDNLGPRALRVMSDLEGQMEHLDKPVREETQGLLDNPVLQVQLGL